MAEKEKLSSIFEKASLLELGFWKMSYRNQNTKNKDEMK
jgi:thiaminase